MKNFILLILLFVSFKDIGVCQTTQDAVDFIWDVAKKRCPVSQDLLTLFNIKTSNKYMYIFEYHYLYKAGEWSNHWSLHQKKDKVTYTFSLYRLYLPNCYIDGNIINANDESSIIEVWTSTSKMGTINAEDYFDYLRQHLDENKFPSDIGVNKINSFGFLRYFDKGYNCLDDDNYKERLRNAFNTIIKNDGGGEKINKFKF